MSSEARSRRGGNFASASVALTAVAQLTEVVDGNFFRGNFRLVGAGVGALVVEEAERPAERGAALGGRQRREGEFGDKDLEIGGLPEGQVLQGDSEHGLSHSLADTASSLGKDHTKGPGRHVVMTTETSPVSEVNLVVRGQFREQIMY